MQALLAFRTMVTHSGKPREVLSKEMGRGKGFLNVTINRGTIPKADTLALIADVCGYDLQLVKRDGTEVIIIDPPKAEPKAE